MPPSVYVETTILSYLTAWDSRDPVMAGRQKVTREWWEMRRRDFILCGSQEVRREAAGGDPVAATRRLQAATELTLLAVTPEATALAAVLQARARIPERAKADAVHVAVAAVHGVDFLLTWNLRHLANAAVRPAMEAACRAAGYAPPAIATPDQLLLPPGG